MLPPEARKHMFGSIRNGLNELNSSRDAKHRSAHKKLGPAMPKFREVLGEVMKLQSNELSPQDSKISSPQQLRSRVTTPRQTSGVYTISYDDSNQIDSTEKQGSAGLNRQKTL